MSEEPPLILYFVPSLVSTLWHDEKKKGSPLTEEEVIAIRDKCPCVALREETVRVMDEKRGYKDIDAENCWEEFQEARIGLIEYENEQRTKDLA